MTAGELDIVIGAEVNGAVNGLKQVNAQLTKTGQTAAQVTTKTSRDFTGLSRIIQDLPFGFTAISNNLTQLLPAAGAAGLAFSAIVSALTFAQVGISSWTRGLKDNKKAVEEEKSALEGLETATAKDVLRLKELTFLASDANSPYVVRTNAVKQLRKEYEPYLKNLSDEKILSGDIEEAIKGINEALLAKLKLQAGEDQLVKLLKQRLDTELKLSALQEKQASTTGFAATLKDATGNAKGLGVQLKRSVELSIPEMGKLQNQIKGIDNTIENLFNLLKKPLTQSAELDLGIPEAAKKLKEIKLTPRVKFDIHAGRVTPLQDTSFETINKEIGEFLAKHPLKPVVTLEPDLVLGEQGQAAIDATFGLINQQIVSGFTALGESLGNALAGAKNPFTPVLAVLSEGLKTIGKAYIEIGVQMLIAKKALSLLMKSPYLTIAAGIALVALGQLLSAKANSVKAFATGGVVTKPTLALVGEQGPERITPLGYEGRANNSWMNGEVVFNISGQNLRGILRRADQTAYNTF